MPNRLKRTSYVQCGCGVTFICHDAAICAHHPIEKFSAPHWQAITTIIDQRRQMYMYACYENLVGFIDTRHKL